MHQPVLPEPNLIAKQQSKSLTDYIINILAKNNNWCSFADYMQLCLYTPKLGYYVGGKYKLGAKGDFITAPEISPLFGATIAKSLIEPLEQLAKKNIKKNILEFGAGTGNLARDILSFLATNNININNYYILDISPDLKHQQQIIVDLLPDKIKNKIKFINKLPKTFSGIILANEVLDAMPANIFNIINNKIFETGVSYDNKQHKFIYQNKPADKYLINFIENNILPIENLPNNYLSECNLKSHLWLKTIANILQTGLIYLIDYGFPTHEYYHWQRDQGTLMCHYQHHCHIDPFYYPGLQDITTHVDFSALADIAKQNNLDIISFIPQGYFLISFGITDLVRPDPMQKNIIISQQIKKLTLPHEMGELFKFLILGKNLDYNNFYQNLSYFDQVNKL